MNSLLLRSDNHLAKRVTQICCDDLMTEWNEMLNGKDDQFVEIPNLIQALYLWSIKGTKRANIYFLNSMHMAFFFMYI